MGNKSHFFEFQFPWSVSLGYFQNGDWKHTCGGAILSNRIILTAANCFDQVDLNMNIKDQNTRLHIKVGDQSLFTNEQNEDFRAIYHPDSYKIHPKHDNYEYDIALVATNSTIVFNELTKPVCLPETDKTKQGSEHESNERSSYVYTL